MTEDLWWADSVLTRRRLLRMSAAAAAGAIWPAAAQASSRATRSSRWPSAALRARDAQRVETSQFMHAEQLLEWHRELDAVGLRATGSAAHEHYIDVLRDRLERAGVRNLTFEPVAHKRWLADSWSLDVTAPERRSIRTAAYIPYSGETLRSGVSGPLTVVDPTGPAPAAGSLSGKVALFSLPPATLTYGTLGALAYKSYDPRHLLDVNATYDRPWLAITTLISILDSLVAADASACICILDLPADAAHGAYYPYDGKIRPVPGVFVDRDTGAELRALAAQGATATVTLRSETRNVKTRNLIGLIPGRSSEMVLLHSHTDGPNAIEDDGPNAIVAISQYLARLPRHALPRTVMVLLTTGHFAGGAGVTEFARRHRHTTLRRTAAGVTLEHLGALEWNPGPNGRSRLTGHAEAGTVFAPESSALVDAAAAAVRRANDDPASVLRPYVIAAGSPDGHGWPAEGTQLWTVGALPTANYITGPTYLLNWGIPTVDKLDVGLMRREAIAFTEMVLALSRVPAGRLRKLDLLHGG